MRIAVLFNVQPGQKLIINGVENPTTGFALKHQVVGDGAQSVSLVS